MQIYKLIIYNSDYSPREIQAECECVKGGKLLEDKKNKLQYWQYVCGCRGSSRIVNFKVPGQSP